MDLKQNYFQLFSIPVAFDVDLSVINAAYRELQRNLHPDRFANSTANEKLLSMQVSSLVNEAKDVLQSPVRRAAYLLELQGHPVDFETNIAMAADFLMEQMELREVLDELKYSSESVESLHGFTQRIDLQMDDLKVEFNSLYTRYLQKKEQSEQSVLLESAEMAVRKMQFMNKLQIEANKIEEDLFD